MGAAPMDEDTSITSSANEDAGGGGAGRGRERGGLGFRQGLLIRLKGNIGPLI